MVAARARARKARAARRRRPGVIVPSRQREARLMELWYHLANVLYLVSYLVTDILWLRVLAVLGGLSSLTWTLTASTPSLTRGSIPTSTDPRSRPSTRPALRLPSRIG